jgi:hypothetical protein
VSIVPPFRVTFEESEYRQEEGTRLRLNLERHLFVLNASVGWKLCWGDSRGPYEFSSARALTTWGAIRKAQRMIGEELLKTHYDMIECKTLLVLAGEEGPEAE